MQQLSITYQPKLDSDQSRVWYFVQDRKGRAAAIPMRTLAEFAFGDAKLTRRVQTAIKELIELGYPIGSSCGKPNGYYVITDVEEFDAAHKQIMNRIRQLSRRNKALRKHRAVLAGQGIMPLDSIPGIKPETTDHVGARRALPNIKADNQ